ncbi:hypothetical protein SDC9_211243 [bioreactor metagenome]|uniref:Uncharacterized protein n=1 Tax=bioreactor metagenome TaxID=1076179 RepID=A0A645JUA9_9ZZZZ
MPRVRISGSKHEEFLAEHLVGYTPPELDPMNRAISQDEQDVIAYLARCVHFNKRPVREPSDRCPPLQDWVQTLASGPRVDGTWPMLEGPWKPHWGSWQRQALEDQEWEEEQDRIMAEIEALSKNSPENPSN